MTPNQFNRSATRSASAINLHEATQAFKVWLTSTPLAMYTCALCFIWVRHT